MVDASSLAPLTPVAPSAPPKTRGGTRRPVIPAPVELSVFDILNIFRRRWFLSRTNLLAHAISAQKAEDGNISWVEFDPPFHSHLVKCAVALVPCPVLKVKKVLFVYILELLQGGGHGPFFDLKTGGRKANNAQKEKRRLARKRSRAAKRERKREAEKSAPLPTRERSCVACRKQFLSRKTARKHKCSKKSKVVRLTEQVTVHRDAPAQPLLRADPSRGRQAGTPSEPSIDTRMHSPPRTPTTTTAHSNSSLPPPVTGGLGGSRPSGPATAIPVDEDPLIVQQRAYAENLDRRYGFRPPPVVSSPQLGGFKRRREG